MASAVAVDAESGRVLLLQLELLAQHSMWAAGFPSTNAGYPIDLAEHL